MMKTFVAALVILTGAGAAHAGLELGQRPIPRSEVISVARKQFAQMDSNKDRGVSFDEFERYREIQNGQPDRGRGLTRIGRSWLDKCDTDGDGKVDVEEAVARPLELFDMADVDRDGVASLNEQSMAALFVK